MKCLVCVTVVTCFLTLVSSQNIDPSNYLGDPCTPGTATANCTDKYKYSLCAQDPVDSSKYQCACNQIDGYIKDATQKLCVLEVGVNGVCEPNSPHSRCKDQYAACVDDGSLSNSYRCRCKETFVLIQTAGQTDDMTCAPILTMDDDPNCAICEANEGTCYRRSQNGQPPEAGCQCDVSRSGAICDTINVNVTCDIETFTMQVCYLPHDGYDFSATGYSKLYPESFGGPMECIGRPNHPNCSGDGVVGLELKLNEEDRTKCGTEFHPSSFENVQYDNLIRVVKNTSEDNGYLQFRVYCSFVKYTYSKFAPIGVARSGDGGTGEHTQPDATLEVLDAYMVKVKQGQVLKVGDVIFLQVLLSTASEYGSFSVDQCIASNKPNMYDVNAFTITLIKDGCAAPSQAIITDANNFRKVNFLLTQMRTGPVSVFQVPTGNSVFVLCQLRVCLKGEEAECAQTDCTAASSGGGSKRKRRATNVKAQVSQEIFIQDPNKGVVRMNSSLLAGIIAVAVIIFVVIVTIMTVVIYRLKRQKLKDKTAPPIWMTSVPPSYPRPRSARPTLRI